MQNAQCAREINVASGDPEALDEGHHALEHVRQIALDTHNSQSGMRVEPCDLSKMSAVCMYVCMKDLLDLIWFGLV